MNHILKTALTPFTTPTAGGTLFRDIFVAITSMIAILTAVGALTSDQADELRRVVDTLSGQWPALVSLFSILSGLAVSIYRVFFLSRSIPADAAARAIDAKLPAGAKVEQIDIKTPPGVDDIKISAATIAKT